ncbi:MAG: hypothetical protein IJW67_13815 [Blautia sp.]|nr:hypothetical protein [Blautia sp.]
MNDSKVIPNWRMEDIRNVNRRIKEATDEVDAELYKSAKAFPVPRERMRIIIKETVEKAISKSGITEKGDE